MKFKGYIQEVETVWVKDNCIIINSTIYETGDKTSEVEDKLLKNGYADLSGVHKRDCL